MPQARYEIDGDVAEIVISNPPLNLWGPSLITDIEDGVARAAAERPRALIVRADGDVFSAGVDVHVFEGLDAQSADALTGRLLRLTHAVEDLPLPTLAVVHGLCLTAGLELSLACDLMWAKAIVRAQADHGTRGADARAAKLTSHLFETDDCR